MNNCVLISGNSALKLGTASYGDFRDCTFGNCVISGSRYGIAMYIKDGALVEGINFANISVDTSVDYVNKRTGASRTWIEYPLFLDLEKRSDDSALGRIRDVSFSDISICTKGRVLVGGPPGRPLENLRFHNLTMRVTGFEAVAGQHKPRGIARIRPAPRETDYSDVPAALIFAHIRGLDLRDIQVCWDTGGQVENRHALYAAQVEDFTLNGFAGASSGSKFAAIGLQATKHVFITAARPDAETKVLLGLSGISEEEVVLTGNDLSHVAKVMAPSVCYVRP